MIDAICRRLREAAPVRLHSDPRAAVVVGVDRDPAAKVTLLVFGADGDLVAVAKVARDARAEAALTTEHRALSQLREVLGPARRDVPTPLLLERIDDRLVHVATAVPGGPMMVGYYTPGHIVDAGRVRRDFTLAGSWLAEFQTSTSTATMSIDAAFDEYVVSVIDRYRAQVAWTPEDAAAFSDLEAAASTMIDEAVPITCVHGDYAIGNILLRDDAVTGVVDWELSRPAGLPVLDVVKFAASYSMYLDRAQPPRRGQLRGHAGWASSARTSPAGWKNFAGFMYGFYGTGWYPDLVRQFLDDHARRLGLSAAAMSLFVRVFLAEQATVLENLAYRNGYRQLFLTVHGMRRSATPMRGTR